MGNNFYKLFTGAFLAGLLAVSVSACSTETSKDGDTENGGDVAGDESTVVIGGILPLTGDGAAYGIPMQAVAQIAIDKVNEEGGIDGKTLEVIWEDGKCNGQDATSAANKLINVDKVQVIYGGFCSSETLGAAPVADSAGVIMLSPGSSSPDVTTAGDYIFRNYPSDASQGQILAGLAAEGGYAKVGMLTEENDYTLGIADVFESSFEGEVVAESFLPTDTDMRTQVTKLKGEGVDMIFVNPQTPAKADIILKQIQDQEIDVPLYGNDVALSWTEGLERYVDVTEGMVGALPTYDSDSQEWADLEAAYIAQTGEETVAFPTYAATSYDAIFILKEAIEAEGYNAEGIKDFLYNVDGWEGLAGTLTIDGNGDPESGHKAMKYEGGEVVMF